MTITRDDGRALGDESTGCAECGADASARLRVSQRIQPGGITVASMHPGPADNPGVATSLPGFRRLTAPLLRSPEQGADTIIWLSATAPTPPDGAV